MGMTGWHVATFVLAALGSGLLTWAWIQFARSRRIQDEPGQRRLHFAATPRGGGVAILVVVASGLLWFGLGHRSAQALVWLAAGVALFGLLGLADDTLAVGTPLKFALQLLAASMLVLPLSAEWALGWPARMVLVIACAYLVNIWNFMDGSNGLVAVQTILIALALAIWPGQPANLQLAALLLAGACLGFLPFNLPVARVFLGDSGSHVLGAAIFGLLLLDWHAGILDWRQGLLLASALLLDSGLTLLRRLLGRKPVWRAHREHLFQYAVRVGHSHLGVCICYGAFTIATIGLALAAEGIRSSLVMSGLLIFSWAIGAMLYVALRAKWLGRLHRGRGNG